MTDKKTCEISQSSKMPPQAYFDEQEAMAKLLPIADKLVALVQAAPAPEQTPASGQSRFKGQKWTECAVEHVAMVLAAPHEWEGYEVRYLYANPVQAQQLMREVYKEFVKDGHGGEFEDGEHPLADRMRAFLAGTPEPEPEPEAGGISEDDRRELVAGAGLLAGHGHKGSSAALLRLLAATDVPASGAVALSDYLKNCDQHSIVPDVGGAFAFAFAAGFNLATPQAAPAALAVPDDRAAFERELIDNHHYVPSDFSFKDGFYGGDDDYIQFGWDVWKACAALASIPAAAAPVAHPHHCTARSSDGACEECEGHAQAMREWKTEQAGDPAAGFEMWWAERMPEATQAQAFMSWTAWKAQPCS